MSENFNSKNLQPESLNNLFNSNYNPNYNIMPSYLRNLNTVIKTQQELSEISWEREGKEVSQFNNLVITPT